MWYAVCVCVCVCVCVSALSICPNKDKKENMDAQRFSVYLSMVNNGVIVDPLGHGTCLCGNCVCNKTPSGNLYLGEVCDCYPDDDICHRSSDDEVG